MNRSVFKAATLLLALCSLCTVAVADEKAVLANVESLRDGSGFFQKDEFRKAALAWSNESVAILKSESSKSATLAAAFSSVLASIAYERAEDALAYAEWGNAVKHYLSAGTNWDEQRDGLFDYLVDVRRELDAASADDSSAYIDTNLQFLIALDTLTGFSVYAQPGSGLSMQRSDREPVVTENRSYFARPLSVVQEEESAKSSAQSENIASSLQELSAQLPPTVAAPADGEDTEQPATNAAELSGDGSRERPFRIAASALPRQPALVNPAPQDPKPEPVVPVAKVETPEKVVPEKPAKVKTTDKKPEKKTPEKTIEAVVEAKTEKKEKKAAIAKAGVAAKTPVKEPKQLPADPFREYQLGEKDLDRAQRAWSYFERNRHPESGFVSSVEGKPEISSWDMAGQLAAIVSAHQIGLLEEEQFNRLMKSTLSGLQAIPLYDDRLPNRQYRLENMQIPADANQQGWSAVSTGRLLIWLRILGDWYPEWRPEVMAVLSRWQFGQVTANGQLNSLAKIGDKLVLQQEGRLGYEQYAAAGFQLWGLNVEKALALPRTAKINVFDVAVAIDKRPSSYLVSDPFVLGAMELSGIYPAFASIGKSVFEVQRARWSNQKQLTAMGSDVDFETGERVNNYVYHADQGTAFNCSSPNGDEKPCQAVSTKIAYGWNALYDDPYSQALVSIVEKGVSSKRGFYSGVFGDLTVNRVLTLDANAIVLESMLLKFRAGEPFLQSGERVSGALSQLLFSRGSWD